MTPTEPTGLVEDCHPELTITPTPGPTGTLLRLDVTSIPAAPVAARCVAAESADEVLLVEDPTVAETHELHVIGLLADRDYTCRAVAVCSPGAASPSVVHHTPPPPSTFSRFDIERVPGLTETGAYTLTQWRRQQQDTAPWMIVWDREGRPRWWMEMSTTMNVAFEALWDPATQTILYGGGRSDLGTPTTVDLWQGIVEPAPLPLWGANDFHHDAKRLEDGRMLSLQAVPNSLGPLSWEGFGIRLWNPVESRVDYELDSQTLVDAGKLPPGLAGLDAYHANWVDLKETPDGAVLYVSLYTLKWLLAIDVETSEVLWTLGSGLGWNVVDADGTPLTDDDLPQALHGAEVRGDEFLVYDNGVQRLESRAERWRIDPTTRTATRLWWWTEPDWFEPVVGDIDDLGNSRVLITQAVTGYTRHHLRIVEVDTATKQVVNRMVATSNNIGGYRAERYGGCDLFCHARECPELAARDAELEHLFALP
ncbi:MAG: aryl-sulfate sulfotransferase [Alphaproteobacteria bacterium]|nr:aryl-sulfate sulfotransferase [Alphaproteobacteria bacterium]MCB9688120.1 aryl-sulfate sulfotransferase [Alphaproteobacteria bacterium]